MSQVPVAPTMTGRYSKRKRAQVNYYEGADEVEELVRADGSKDDTECPPPKKRKSASSKPLPKRKQFPFLELPAEIRNMIYGYCLTDPAGVYLQSTTKKYRRTVHRVPEDWFRGIPMPRFDSHDSDDGTDSEKEAEKAPGIRKLVPALLAVNKQIYHEGRDILYGNHFHLGDTLAMHSFLVDLGPRAASTLKQVTLISWGAGRGVHKAYNHAGFAALAPATNIEKLKVHGYQSWRGDPKAVATQFYRDAFPWLEAVGAAKQKVDAAADVIELSCDTFKGGVGWNSWNTQRWRDDSGIYKDMAGFRAELSKLLGGRMKMIRS